MADGCVTLCEGRRKASAGSIHGPRSQPLSLRANQCREADLASRCAKPRRTLRGFRVSRGTVWVSAVWTSAVWGRTVRAGGPVAPAALQPAEEGRIVEVDVAQRGAQ